MLLDISSIFLVFYICILYFYFTDLMLSCLQYRIFFLFQQFLYQVTKREFSYNFFFCISLCISLKSFEKGMPYHIVRTTVPAFECMLGSPHSLSKPTLERSQVGTIFASSRVLCLNNLLIQFAIPSSVSQICWNSSSRGQSGLSYFLF